MSGDHPKQPFWVGVKNRPPQTVFQAVDAHVTAESYPQFAYVIGPFKDQKAAKAVANTHINKDGTFTDPFCNNGGGR